MKTDDRAFVYSTDGTLPLAKTANRKHIKQNASHKKPAPIAPGVPDDGLIRVGHERRRVGGVTIIYGVPASDRAALARELKARCGTGGTLKPGSIELQGDHRDSVIAHLTTLGHKPKRMGG